MQDPADTIEMDTEETGPAQRTPDAASDPLIASFAAALSWAERNIQPARERTQGADESAAIPDDVPRFRVRR